LRVEGAILRDLCARIQAKMTQKIGSALCGSGAARLIGRGAVAICPLTLYREPPVPFAQLDPRSLKSFPPSRAASRLSISLLHVRGIAAARDDRDSSQIESQHCNRAPASGLATRRNPCAGYPSPLFSSRSTRKSLRRIQIIVFIAFMVIRS